jgi:hypothetical protein
MIYTWTFIGTGKCEGALAFVRGRTLADATARLLRDDASPFFTFALAFRVVS